MLPSFANLSAHIARTDSYQPARKQRRDLDGDGVCCDDELTIIENAPKDLYIVALNEDLGGWMRSGIPNAEPILDQFGDVNRYSTLDTTILLRMENLTLSDLGERLLDAATLAMNPETGEYERITLGGRTISELQVVWFSPVQYLVPADVFGADENMRAFGTKSAAFLPSSLRARDLKKLKKLGAVRCVDQIVNVAHETREGDDDMREEDARDLIKRLDYPPVKISRHRHAIVLVYKIFVKADIERAARRARVWSPERPTYLPRPRGSFSDVELDEKDVNVLLDDRRRRW